MIEQTTLASIVKAEMKVAMKARDKMRLGAIRLIQAEFKRVEVDERTTIDDDRAITILDKMLKQRRDSARQFDEAGRHELSQQELYEIGVIKTFLPAQFTEAEIIEIINVELRKTGLSDIAEMGKLMASLKPQLKGRADMGMVSALVKKRLSS